MNNVRLAKPTDSRQIAELYGQLVQNPQVSVLPERIEKISCDPNTGLFVCEYGGLVEGTALVSLCADVMFGLAPIPRTV